MHKSLGKSSKGLGKPKGRSGHMGYLVYMNEIVSGRMAPPSSLFVAHGSGRKLIEVINRNAHG